MGEDVPIQSIRYLKDLLTKVCIQALQSEQIGEWVFLLEVLGKIKPLGDELIGFGEVQHYTKRVYQFCENNHNLQSLDVIGALCNTFPSMDFQFTRSESETGSAMNATTTHLQQNSVQNRIVIPKEPYLVEDFQDIFKFLPEDLDERIYEPKRLKITDIQLFLPFVVSELSKLESTWKNCLGSTLTALNTDIPQTIQKLGKHSFHSSIDNNLPDKKQSYSPKPSHRKLPAPKTGREVVEYLVHTNRNIKANIWYLNFMTSKTFHPYKLQVASKSTVKKDHVVISVFGVLRVRQSGNSELTPLVQWYMESTYFNVIHNIPFFKNYYLIRAFKRWKINHRYNQFVKIFKRVSNRTLLDLPVFPNTIVQVATLLNQFESVKLLPDFSTGHIHFKSINFLMWEQLEIGSKYFSRLFSYIQDVFNECYFDSVDYINYCQSQLDIQQSSNSKESMSVARKRKELQKENLTCANRNLERLSSYVSLINQKIFSHLVYIHSQQIYSFVCEDLLQNENGCFYMFVDISLDSELVLSPNNGVIFNLVTQYLSEILNIIDNQIKKIQLHTVTDDTAEGRSNAANKKGNYASKLKNILDERQQRGTKIPKEFDTNANDAKESAKYAYTEAMMSHDVVKFSVDKLEEELLVATEEANEMLKSYSWIYEIIQLTVSWGAGEMESWNSLPPSVLEKQILQINAWAKEIESIIPNFISSNGVLFVDCSTICSSLLPQLNNILEKIVSKLASSNFEEVERLSSDMNQKIEVISVTPVDIDSFSKYFVYINGLELEVGELRKKVFRLRGVLDVIKHCCRQLSTEEEEHEEMIVRVWENYMFSLQTAKEYLSAQSSNQLKKMNEEMAEMQKQILDIVRQATSGVFIDADQNAPYILKEMKRLYILFENLLERLKAYGSCKATITGENIDLSKVYAAQKEINARYSVWRYLELSLQTINEWKRTLFGKLNVKKVYGKVQEWLMASENLKTDIKRDDAVMKKWVNLIKNFSNNINVMKELANPALKIRHWKEIFVVLGHVYEDKLYCVSDIISMPIIDNVFKISQICLAASSESALQNCLNGLIKHWEKRNFKFAKKIQDMDVKKERRDGWYDTEEAGHDQKAKLTSVGYILTGINELACELEDNLVTLQSMLGSPHVAEVRDLAGSWNAKLQEVKEILDLWMAAQQEWLYLGNVFSKFTMQQLHPVEFHIFIESNQLFKEIIDSIMADSKVLDILNKRAEFSKWDGPNKGFLKQILQLVIQKQSVVIKQMEEHLSKIQSTFPRLYYLSNDEMLNLLAITRNPPAIVPFVRKCFPAIKDVKFGMPKTENALSSLDVTLNVHRLEATGFVGMLDEMVEFNGSLPFNTAIEKWLKLIEVKMKESIWINFGDCAHEANGEYMDQLSNIETIKKLSEKFTFQSIALYMDVLYGSILKDHLFQRNSYSGIDSKLNENISILSKFLQDSRLFSTGYSHERKFFLLVQVLLMKVQHYQDQILILKRQENLSVSSFEWLKLIKLETDPIDIRYANKAPKIIVSCINTSFKFGYEYFGPIMGLVYTPLVDRCIFSLLLSLSHHQVGCLTGCEQTGKSETSFEIAKLLGRHFISLNCTIMTPLSIINTFLRGALTTGSILCLENIHLLQTNKLSVLGQVVSNLSHALKCVAPITSKLDDSLRSKSEMGHNNYRDKIKHDSPYVDFIDVSSNVTSKREYITPRLGNILFSGNLVEVSSLYGCFVTTDASFNDWTSIPDNLRESLRPVAFMNLDECYIFKIWFLTSGFQNYEMLAQKLQFLTVSLKDKGYFSLQILHHLISQTGSNMQSRKSGFADREVMEFSNSLINMIKPSVPRQSFLAVAKEVNNIFTPSKDGVTVNSITDTLLLESVREQINSDNLSPKSEFVNKVLELHQVLSSNQTVILSGGVGSGKTTCYKTLARSLCQFYSPWSQRVDILTESNDANFARVNVKIFYPNVLLADQLYGYFDCTNNTPVDGLLTKIISNIAVLENVTSKHSESRLPSEHALSQIQQWFVMDGFIDESWITPFYSLLDYSKQFVLGSGKRIRLLDNMKIIFETDQMASISPSLISRCAILHFESGNVVNWRAVFNSWKTGAYNKYCITQKCLDCIELVLEYALETIVDFIYADCEVLFSTTCKGGVQSSRNAAVVECNYVLQVLSAVLEFWKSRDVSTTNIQMDESALSQFICHALAYSIASGLSALVHQSSLQKLDAFIRRIFSMCPVCSVIVTCPIMDCFFDGKTGSLVQWNEEKFSSQMSVASNMIMSKETQQYYHLADLLITSKCNVLLVGEPGCGKSSLVKYMLSSKHQILKLQMSRAMDINYFQEIVRAKSKNWLKRQSQRGKLKTAKTALLEKMILFLDDVNLVVTTQDSPDQPVLECIRQMICEGGVYDFDGKYFHHLPPLQLVTSYTSPEMDFVGGSVGNSLMNDRFRRHFNLIHLRQESKEQMTSFFSRHCFWLEGLNWLPFKTNFAEAIAVATVNVHEMIRSNFPPTVNPLYIFSKHDMSRVFKMLTMLSANGNKKASYATKNRVDTGKDEVSATNGEGIGKGNNFESKFIEQSVSEYIALQKSIDDDKKQLTAKLKDIIFWWYRVVNQVYSNRYTSDEDSKWFASVLAGETKKLYSRVRDLADRSIKSGSENVNTGFSSDRTNEMSIESMVNKQLFFCPFLTKESSQFICKEDFKTLLHDAMKKFNEESIIKKLDLVFFDELLYHTESLCRVFNISSGHALLISQNGYGLRDLVKLLAKLISASFFDVSSSSKHADHKLQIKEACSIAGLKGKPVIIFAPEKLPEETLVYLSALICDGLCPGLYSSNELPMICNQLLPTSHRMRTNNEGYGQIEDRFFQRIKQNLHIVICLNHSKNLNATLQKFPMLIHKVACIDVYRTWTEDNWFHVAYNFLRNCSLDFIKYNGCLFFNAEQYMEVIARVMAKIHLVTREHIGRLHGEKIVESYSPRKFIEFVHNFLCISRKHIYNIQEDIRDLKKATKKIVEAEEVIMKLKDEIKQLLPVFTESKLAVKQANIEMTDSQNEFVRMKQMCEMHLSTIEELNVPYEVLKDETDKDFKKLSPQYERAMSSLKLLDHYAIDELRSYHRPPECVKYICQMLCEMFRVPPLWEEAKTLMMRENFLEDVLSYDKNAIEGSVFKKLTEFVNNSHSQPERVQTVSYAAYQLSTWMHAIHSYGCILRELEPKKKSLENAKQRIIEAENVLLEKFARRNHNKDLAEKKHLDYKEKLLKSNSLEKKKLALEAELKHAQDLLSAAVVFTSEWSRRICKGEENLKTSTGDCILTGAAIVYINILLGDGQEELLLKLKSVIISEGNRLLSLSDDLTPTKILSNNVEPNVWMKNMEFNDQTLVEYALKIKALTNFRAKCWPFLIDPHGVSKTLVVLIEGGKKIKDFSNADKGISSLQEGRRECYNMRSSENCNGSGYEDMLLIVDADVPGLQFLLENAMLLGSAVLLQHIERLEDTSCISYLFNIGETGGYFKMPGETEVKNCHAKFRLYISATISINSLEEEKYKSCLHRTVAFNLGMSKAALQTEVLHKVISACREELNTSKERNKHDLLYLKQEEKQVHVNIFNKVKTLKNNILDEPKIEDLIGFHCEQLMLLDEKILECNYNIKEVTAQMSKYEALAIYLTSIYGIVQKIQNVHPLYHFSLQSFFSLLENTFTESSLTKATIACPSARIEETKNKFTEKIYNRLSMSLFKEHTILFPLHVVLENMIQVYDLKEEEILLFSHGFDESEAASCSIVDKKADWIGHPAWCRLNMLSSTVNIFSNLLADISHNDLIWQEYFKLEPMTTSPPGINDINDFYLGLLWLAYDSTLKSVVSSYFINRQLGPTFVNIPSFNLHHTFMLSSSETIINTVLLPDNDEALVVDPLLVIRRLANEQCIPGVTVVSMNHNEQLEQAINAINIASKGGSWVVLQNCHLVEAWKQCFINSLENIHNKLRCNATAKQRDCRFHLWMVLRAGNNVKLPAYVIENSYPIVWQFSKTAIGMRSIVDKLDGQMEDVGSGSTQLEHFNYIQQQIFQDEITKNDARTYSKHYKISLNDLLLSKCVPDIFRTHNDISNIGNIIKEIVYLPRLYTKFDRCLLWKSQVIRMLHAKKDIHCIRSSLHYSDCQRDVKLLKPFKYLCDSNRVDDLVTRFQAIQAHSKSVKFGAIEKNLITTCINEEIYLIHKNVKVINYHLFLVKKVLGNKMCRTKLTETVYRAISSNTFPDIWKATWKSAEMQCKVVKLDSYIDMIQEALDHFHSILGASGEIRIPFDLAKFNSPKKLINSIKLYHALKNVTNVEDDVWVGKIVPDVSSTSPMYSDNGVFIESVNVVNATFDVPSVTIFYLGTMCMTKLPLIHLKPQMIEARDNNAVTLPVYSSNRNETLFDVSVNASSDIISNNVYMVV